MRATGRPATARRTALSQLSTQAKFHHGRRPTERLPDLCIHFVTFRPRVRDRPQLKLRGVSVSYTTKYDLLSLRTYILLVASEGYTDCDGRTKKYMKGNSIPHFEVLYPRLSNCCSQNAKLTVSGNCDNIGRSRWQDSLRVEGQGIKSRWERDFPHHGAHPASCTTGAGFLSRE